MSTTSIDSPRRCGPSRQASDGPLRLLPFGMRVVIAPSIADIFHGGFMKSVGLPTVLDGDGCRASMVRVVAPPTARVEVWFVGRVIRAGDCSMPFRVPDAVQDRSSWGADEIDRSLSLMPQVAAFERDRRYAVPTVLGV